jgi:signal transduction histidine kinase
MTFQTKLAAAYGLAVVILCAMGVVSYRNATNIEATRAWGRHSNVVIRRSEAFSLALERMKSLAFEYAGTDDAAAAASVAKVRKDVESAEADLRRLTMDNESQQQRLDVFEPELKHYLDVLQVSVAAAPVAGKSLARKKTLLPEQAALERELETMVQQINAEEDRLALLRRESIDMGLRRGSYFLIFGYVSAILLSVFCIAILRNEMRARAAVNHKLEQAQAELERRVEQRIEDFRAANAALQGQVEERKKAEQRVHELNASLELRVEQRTLELTEAVNELEAFCYSVSHDLRAPLRHVDGFSRILESEHGKQLDPKALHYLHRIVQGVNQMGRLIDDLLALSRIGRKKLSRKRVSVQDTVERVVANYRSSVEGQGVEWHIDALPDLSCDPGLLELAYVSLVENSVKFTRDSSPRVIQFGTFDSDGVVTLFVRDNGVGFDPKYADKLFGVFQRLHRQEDFEGTGIGLATVQRIIQRHGGTIRAESRPGCGATFYFTLGAESAVAHADNLEEVKHARV